MTQRLASGLLFSVTICFASRRHRLASHVLGGAESIRGIQRWGQKRKAVLLYLDFKACLMKGITLVMGLGGVGCRQNIGGKTEYWRTTWKVKYENKGSERESTNLYDKRCNLVGEQKVQKARLQQNLALTSQIWLFF